MTEALKQLIQERLDPDLEVGSLPVLTKIRMDVYLDNAINACGVQIQQILEGNPDAVTHRNTLGQFWITQTRKSRFITETKTLFHYGPELKGSSSYILLLKGCESFIEFISKVRKDIRFRPDMKSEEFLRENKSLEVQDRAYIAGRLLGYCEVLNDSAKTADEKISAAFEAGQLLQAFTTESRVCETNRINAQKKQPKKIDAMIRKLARIDAPTKGLWVELEGLLDVEEFDPEEDQEQLRYFYENESGKRKSITFRTFSNKLSAERKRKISRNPRVK